MFTERKPSAFDRVTNRQKRARKGVWNGYKACHSLSCRDLLPIMRKKSLHWETHVKGIHLPTNMDEKVTDFLDQIDWIFDVKGLDVYILIFILTTIHTDKRKINKKFCMPSWMVKAQISKSTSPFRVQVWR